MVVEPELEADIRWSDQNFDLILHSEIVFAEAPEAFVFFSELFLVRSAEIRGYLAEYPCVCIC